VKKYNISFTSVALFAVCLALFLRFLVLGMPALNDPSEGRFASAAQQMVLSGDWVTPKIHDYGEGWKPYWAKPPLHMWLTAASLKLFGMNEFAARLPSFIALLISYALIALLAYKKFGKEVMCCSLLMYILCLGAYGFSPSCLTDASLSACITGALVAFFLHATSDNSKSRLSGILFFVALALGMLVKGPVAIVLTGVPIALWCIWNRNLSRAFSLPWGIGLCFFIVIAAPWYLVAEFRTPGFLKYFFVEENFKRYLSSHLNIKYGSAHRHMYGMIWIMNIATAFPASLFFLWLMLKKDSRDFFKVQLLQSENLRFIFLWAISPALFFTMARQILPTYTFPGLPGLALLLGFFASKVKISSKLPYYAGAVPIISCSIILFLNSHLTENRSTKAILSYIYAQLPPANKPYALAALYNDPRTGQFYADGIFKDKIKLFSGRDIEFMKISDISKAIIKSNDLDKLPPEKRSQFQIEKSIGEWDYVSLKKDL
jgi:4-amino-4-deoxy-L-arabinose transferase-like glycosyltransferase